MVRKTQTSQSKGNSPKRKDLNPSSFSNVSTKKLLTYVYGDPKGWKITEFGATSQYGIEISRMRLEGMAIERYNNPYADA